MPPIVPISLGTPVVSARLWAEALVPRNAGGWNYIAQLYQFPNANPSEWVVMHLETGNYHIDIDTTWTPGDRGRYVNSTNLHTLSHQQRAPNGRLLYPAISMWWWYYDPDDETVHDMGQLVDTLPSNAFYSVAFNHDGSKFYSGGIASGNSPNHLPVVVEFDPIATPPTANNLGRVGSLNHTQSAYAYYIWADGDWLYVLVGQDVWDCVAVEISTKTATVLSTLGAGSWAFFKEIVGQGLTVQMISNYGQPSQSIDQFWVYNGATYPYVVGVPPPFPAHDVSKYTNPLVNPPSIDSSPAPEGVLWRPNGSTGDYTLNPYSINHAVPVTLDALTTLPSGEILGNVIQYQGFFRYSPGTGQTVYYGLYDQIAETCYCPTAIGGKVYFAGYPNGILLEYNPNAAWVTTGPNTTNNPKKLGNYSNGITFSGVKRANNLGYSSVYNRMYMTGMRDRSGTGGGIGYYDFVTKTFGGTFAGLSYYTGHIGLAVFDNLDRFIFSGAIGGAGSPASAELVLYDHNCVEIERQIPIVGLTDTGKIFRTGEAQVVMGISITDRKLYRWNVVTKVLDAQVDIAAYGAVVNNSICQKTDGTVIAILGTTLVSIDPLTLAITEMGTLSDPAFLALTPSGNDLFGALDTELVQIEGDTPTNYDLTLQAGGFLLTGRNASLSEGTADEIDMGSGGYTLTGNGMQMHVVAPMILRSGEFELDGRPMTLEAEPENVGVAGNIVRITRLLLSAGASYTIGFTENQNVNMRLDLPSWIPYTYGTEQVSYAAAIDVQVIPASPSAGPPISVRKTGTTRQDFTITLRNDGVVSSGELEVYLRYAI